MNFTQAVAALDARIIERMVPDLDRVRALSEMLGQPQRSYPSIHITGTNGKTTAAIIASALLRAAGLAVGTYTSPHLHSVTERIAFDGTPISEERFAEVFTYLEPYLEHVDAQGQRVTWFETLTVLAEVFFSEQPVDVAVMEVGMGGTWDATNLVDGQVALITDITLDHPELGSTPAEIAREKAGIIKEHSIVVTGVRDVDALAVIRARCAEVNAELREFGRDVILDEPVLAVGGQSLTVHIGGTAYEGFFLPLYGAALARDAALALAAVQAFLGDRPLDAGIVHEAFAGVSSPGRMEVVGRAPLTVLDGAHNPAAAEAVADAVTKTFGYERLIVVAGILADKDVAGVLAPFAKIAALVVATQNTSPRSATPERIAKEAVALGANVRTATSLEGALGIAREEATERDCVLVTGSLYTVAEARQILARNLQKKGN